jgi:hypothetical protein
VPTIGGIGVTVLAIGLFCSAFVVSLQAAWTRIAVRVAGSWVAAVGMLARSALPLPGSGRGASWALLAGAALAIVVGWSFSSLTVRVGADELKPHFGFGWPRKAVPLADIASVELTRTRFWDGVHRTRRGWLYNVGGYDAVVLSRRDGTAVLVGSDDAPRLKAAIERARKHR